MSNAADVFIHIAEKKLSVTLVTNGFPSKRALFESPEYFDALQSWLDENVPPGTLIHLKGSAPHTFKTALALAHRLGRATGTLFNWEGNRDVV